MAGKTYPMRLINLCRHKTAGWEGFIFVNTKGEVQVTNGICVWPLAPHQITALEIVDTIDTRSILASMTSHPGNETLATVLREELPDFRQDMQYLSKPLVDEVCYVINGECVRIYSPHAILVEVWQKYSVSQEDLLDTYRQLLRLSKELHVTIYDTSINHTDQILKTKWNEYETAIIRRGILFSSMVTQARIVETRGIHHGYANDKELSTLLELQRQARSYDSADSVITCINTLQQKLVNMCSRLLLESDGLIVSARAAQPASSSRNGMS